MRAGVALTLLILLTQALSGCFGDEESIAVVEDDSPFYFNIGEVKTRKSTFPIYSIPASIRIGEGEVSIIFDTQVYANKKCN